MNKKNKYNFLSTAGCGVAGYNIISFIDSVFQGEKFNPEMALNLFIGLIAMMFSMHFEEKFEDAIRYDERNKFRMLKK